MTKKTLTQLKNRNPLGRRLVIPASAPVATSSGHTHAMLCDTVDLVIGIGKDHVAYLTMSKEAHTALLNGEKLSF